MRKAVWFGPGDSDLLRRVEEMGVPFSRLVRQALEMYLDGPPSPISPGEIAEAVVARLRQEGLVVAPRCEVIDDDESLAESQLTAILEGALGQYGS